MWKQLFIEKHVCLKKKHIELNIIFVQNLYNLNLI